EPFLAYRFGPLRLDFEHSSAMDVDRLPTSASEEHEASRAAFLSPAFDIAETFQLTDQVVCGLAGYVDALVQIARTHAVRMGIHKYVEESLVEVAKSMLP